MTEFHPNKLGLISTILQSNVDKKSKPDEPAVELCNYTDVYYNDTITTDLDFMKATASPDQIVRLRLAEGDVIITKDSETADDIGIPAYVDSTHDSLVCGYHLTVLRAHSGKVFPKFLYYLMLSRETSEYWEKRANGVTRVSIPQQTVSSLPISLPDLETQRCIADYLDKEISEMDALIEEFEGLVGSLRYRKKRFVEFEFQKSERWNLVPQRLKLLVDSEDNRRVPIDSGDRKDIQGEYPYYGASGVIDYVNDYIWDNEKRLLVSEDGANLAMRNHPIAFVADGQYWVNNHAHVLKPRHNYPAELLAAAIEISPIHHLITGSAQPKLTAFNMGEIAFPFPKDTDSAISMNVFIQEELSRMDALIEESTKLIENLKARKTALITEVVTGRKEV
ncbi:MULTISPECIES: restriction endonuclease subunit S [Corynebacterium]|uniref:restriction endonuclease subunit S n=1 Tax=Corynebacterium TaxID=1716 RepID=UPI0008A20B9F|nr:MULTISPECIES: restriction endonuclease subunit S [Corynebacterium]MDK8800604.1 restriction endonuclease subunit S [Corynebacterium coyleae]MDK8824403.1 restriction endonuclease subunit S [Corynebacterium coyleae]OFU52404.1 hypothetical protein HMPREF3120_09965 [Corynebacterium sp. HMSC11D10]OHQ55706.1 hypothetical protein HMPREF2617_05895 [Corynebacterium sp. HMSC070H05]